MKVSKPTQLPSCYVLNTQRWHGERDAHARGQLYRAAHLRHEPWGRRFCDAAEGHAPEEAARIGLGEAPRTALHPAPAAWER